MQFTRTLALATAIGLAAAVPASAQTETNGLTNFSGWIEAGVGIYSEETTIDYICEDKFERDGMGSHVEVGVRAEMPRAEQKKIDVWGSLSHLNIGFDDEELKLCGLDVNLHRADVQESDSITFLSLGIEKAPSKDQPGNLYGGIFVGTKSSIGFIGGVRYRFENNIELGGKILFGRKESNGTLPVYTSPLSVDPNRRRDIGKAAMYYFAVTLGYAF